jgi:hypothetical protein
MDERPDSSQQLMDILLVMDEKGTLQAVSGVKDGELQTKNPLEDNNDLLRVDRHGDMFSNFFSNLWNQLKDPTRFHFFRVPEEEVQRVAADFRQRESQSVKTGEPLVAQYEVQPPVQAQQQTQAGQQQQPEGAPQQSAGQTEQNPQYKYRPEDIDWNSLAALGVQREQIEGNGMLDQMLRGFQTDKTVRVHFHFDGISHSNDSQLSLKPGTDGRLTVCSHGILDPEKMQKQFFGYDITDYANFGGENVVAVRVDVSMEEGWFYEGAGIYRHTWLEKTSPVHVAPDGTFVRTEVRDASAEIAATATIENSGREPASFIVEQQILAPDGQVLATTTSTGAIQGMLAVAQG